MLADFFSVARLKWRTYLYVGLASEAPRGKEPIFDIRFAPGPTSGPSIGVLQFDFRQNRNDPVVRAYIERYNDYARSVNLSLPPSSWLPVFIPDLELIANLTAHAPLPANFAKSLNEFNNSPEGREWIYEHLDNVQLTRRVNSLSNRFTNELDEGSYLDRLPDNQSEKALIAFSKARVNLPSGVEFFFDFFRGDFKLFGKQLTAQHQGAAVYDEFHGLLKAIAELGTQVQGKTEAQIKLDLAHKYSVVEAGTILRLIAKPEFADQVGPLQIQVFFKNGLASNVQIGPDGRQITSVAASNVLKAVKEFETLQAVIDSPLFSEGRTWLETVADADVRGRFELSDDEGLAKAQVLVMNTLANNATLAAHIGTTDLLSGQPSLHYIFDPQQQYLAVFRNDGTGVAYLADEDELIPLDGTNAKIVGGQFFITSDSEEVFARSLPEGEMKIAAFRQYGVLEFDNLAEISLADISLAFKSPFDFTPDEIKQAHSFSVRDEERNATSWRVDFLSDVPGQIAQVKERFYAFKEDLFGQAKAEVTKTITSTFTDAGVRRTLEGLANGNQYKVQFQLDSFGNPVATSVDLINGIVPSDSQNAVERMNELGLLPDIVDSQTEVVATTAVNQLAGALFSFDSTKFAGAKTLSAALSNGVLNDALNYLESIQLGIPLPEIHSGLKLAENIVPHTLLNGAQQVADGVSNVTAFADALERGDTIGILTNAQDAIGFAGQVAEFAFGSKGILKDASDLVGSALKYEVLGVSIGKAIPYAGLVNAIREGNPVDIAISVISAINPVAGIILNLASTLINILNPEPPPTPWGNAAAVWGGSRRHELEAQRLALAQQVHAWEEALANAGAGADIAGLTAQLEAAQASLSGWDESYKAELDAIVSGARPDSYAVLTRADGKHGGQQATLQAMDSLIATLSNLVSAQQQVNAGDPIGLVANRLPSIGFRGEVFSLTDIDPVTGVQNHPQVRYTTSGHPFGAPPGSVQGSQTFSQRFLHIALERGAIAPLWEATTGAIQSAHGDAQAGLTEEERAGRNNQLAAPVTAPDQTWRPIALDLNGDGVQTTGETRSVSFDVDDSGFFKNTTWLSSADGFLVLDRNINGEIDSGRELFSNSKVALGARGLNGLRWTDANYDGRINSVDPVWNELRVWRDANADGIVDAGEKKRLNELGITSVNYAMATFEQDGALKQLASPDFKADTQGSRAHAVAEGIVIETSEGQTSLVVTRIEDRTSVNGNRDGVAVYEDMEALIPVADLLANDTLGGRSGLALSVIGVGNFTHGTGFLDPNGFIHYTPDADYYGPAGFTYLIQAPTGQTGTAVVDLNVQNVNDAPTAVAAPLNNWDGTIVVTDIDDPDGSFTYAVTQQSQAGQGTVTADGSYHYINWYAPGTPGVMNVRDFGIFRVENYDWVYDPFTVTVTDPHGASGQATMPTYHYGHFITPSEGGGGKKPISVDLDGNGFDFTDVDDSNVFFDINSDGWKRRMAWPGAGDGLLAYDANRDRKITNGDEISFAKYLQGARTDLEGLKAFDTDEDGAFTNADAAWHKFGIWRDANLNGLTDPGEFSYLDELGVASVSLASDEQFQVIDRQSVHGVGTMSMLDGTTLQLADVTLSVSNDVLITRADGAVEIVDQPVFGASDTITGTSDKDLVLGRTGSNKIDALDGNDVVFEDMGADVIDAGAGNDIVYSGVDNDMVFAGVGDDAVFGGAAHDFLIGDLGEDTLFGESGNDVIFGGLGNDLVNGGAGNDVLTGDDGEDEVYGDSGRDVLFGGAGDDVLAGMEGDDILHGDGGNDSLDGGAGEDEMHGGAGDDTYVVDSAVDEVHENAGEGRDTVKASISYTLSAELEDLTLLGHEDVEGQGNELDNIIIGNGGSNILTGGLGNDVLKGGEGVDSMTGGAGDDTYVVDNAGDVVKENAGDGLDTVYSSVSYATVENVENLTLTGFRDIDATGNAADNALVGNSGANRLDGVGGADSMAGGEGDDSYVVENAGDRVTEAADEGYDTAYSAISYVTPLEVEKLVLAGADAIDATGNAQANMLVGNSASNRLDGAGGADTMIGGAGDDTYVVDDSADTVIEAGGEGTDTVYSSVSWQMSGEVEILTLTGTADVDATGNAAGNILIGNSGANRLDGGGSADRMQGNGGNDSYVVDNDADVVVEAADGGMDMIYSSVSYAAPEAVENLTLLGGDDIDATGNELENLLVGNAGANRLAGGGGGDTLTGGAGNDIYVVDNSDDVVVELAGEGVDTILSSVTYAAADEVENLTLTGTEHVNGTGNALANALNGNSGRNTLVGALGDDVLDGGAGADVLAGGQGDDTYIVDHAADAVVENYDEGTDTVYSSLTYATAAHVENLTLTGMADVDATGNDGVNTLIGNSGGNHLDGAAGADVLSGAGGDDSYVVDDVGDAVVEIAGQGTDTVFSSVSYVTPLEVEKVVLTGEADIDAMGNGQANVLIGNTGANRLDGAASGDILIGGAGDDTYVVDDAADTVVEEGGEGHDTAMATVSYALAEHVEDLRLGGAAAIEGVGNRLNNSIWGNDAANVLSGGAGRDWLSGGGGDDTYVYNIGDGFDSIVDSTGHDTLRFGAGFSLENVALRVASAGGLDLATVRILDSNGCEQADQGFDFALLRDTSGELQSTIERFTLSDGSVVTWQDLLIQQETTYGSKSTSSIVTGRNDDLVYGWVFAEDIRAGSGNDIVYAGNGGDRVFGEGGDDYLSGGLHDDLLDAGFGIDLLTGGIGADSLNAFGPKAAADGGMGRDVLRVEGEAIFVAGGKDDDVIETSATRNVLAYNVGDGRDVVFSSAGARTTLSLGGGVDFRKLGLERTGNDLIFNLSSNGSITLHDWYADAPNQNVSTLQVFSNTNGQHAQDVIVDTYDFAGAVASFDQAMVSAQGVNKWSLMNALLDSHLGSSRDAAVGGDLAAQYADQAALAGIGVGTVQSILRDSQFGVAAQSFSPLPLSQAGERLRE